MATKIARASWETFQADIEARANEIATQLPSNVPRDRFINAAIAAVKTTPDLLTATPRSLMSAVVKAAQDGLLPDGREGVITVYDVRVSKNPDVFEKRAQWNPMFYGIRKRARELDGIIIDAQVVVEGDDFDFELGDNPFIRHKPKARSEAVDASKGIAVYAIFRKDGGILHREVMWKPEVFATMNQSRAKGSLMWTVFWTEGWKKSVGRRASKSVPVSPALERIITRNDEDFEFATREAVAARPTMPAIPDAEAPKQIEQSSQMPVFDERESVGELHNSDHLEGDENEALADTSDHARYLDSLDASLSTARDADTVNRLFQQSGCEDDLAGDDAALTAAYEIRARHLERVEPEEEGFNFDD